MDNDEIIEKLPSSLFSRDALDTKKFIGLSLDLARQDTLEKAKQVVQDLKTMFERDVDMFEEEIDVCDNILSKLDQLKSD